MKKWIAGLCVVALVFSMTGCSKAEKTSVKEVLQQALAGEITVSSYDLGMNKAFLEKAAEDFEKKNPGTRINIEMFGPEPIVKEMGGGEGMAVGMVTMGDDTQMRQDYIGKINTELMSGKGADVLATDILPYHRYADGGQLEDLQLYMDADSGFDIKDYRKNILDAVKYRGGQYVMPLDYSFDYLAYDGSLFIEAEKQGLDSNDKVTYDQLIQMGKDAYNRANKASVEPIRMFRETAGFEMFNTLLHADYEKYIDIENKTAHLDDGSFAGLLESVSTYGEEGYLKPYSKSDSFTMEDMNKIMSEQFFYKTKSYFSMLEEAQKNAGIKPINAVSIGGGNESSDKTLGFLADSQGNVGFSTMQTFGLNSNSKNKALAWAFIKFLMSDEVQSSYSGLPVNNAARMEMAKELVTGGLFSTGSTEQSTALTPDQKKAFDSYMQSIEAFSDALNTYYVQDETINHMIAQETGFYFDGSKTSKEVAESLQKKIELYLNE